MFMQKITSTQRCTHKKKKANLGMGTMTFESASVKICFCNCDYFSAPDVFHICAVGSKLHIKRCKLLIIICAFKTFDIKVNT